MSLWMFVGGCGCSFVRSFVVCVSRLTGLCYKYQVYIITVLSIDVVVVVVVSRDIDYWFCILY